MSERNYTRKAKRVDNGEWVEGYYLAIEEKTYIICNAETMCMDGENTDLYATEWYEINPATICDPTGLNDKKGNLIWENDIVKFDVYKYEKLVSSTISDIEWCEDLCSLSVVVNKQGVRGTLGHFHSWNIEVEVIGNIFDNPELLEVEA